MWRDAVLVAGKDLRIEARSKVTTGQVAPFAFLVLIVFAFALDPDRGVLAAAASGLFWIAVTFAALLAVQRSFGLEAGDGARDGLRLSGMEGGGIFLGKAAAIGAQLLLLEAVLGLGIVVLYGTALHHPLMLLVTAGLSTVGLAVVGTVYGVLAGGLRVRETLLPVLLLPIVAPVVLAATKGWDAALHGPVADGWPWVRLLAVFAAIYVAFGLLAFGPLLEET